MTNIYDAGEADVAVVGAGHAGIEAALACARMGLRTLLFTINLDAVGNMPCNPAIGGTGKGHLVHEIDALGGEMGLAADHVTLQSRLLNRGKGPAVHSRRIQADRIAYRAYMKHVIETTPHLSLIQAEIVDILCEGEGEGRHVDRVVSRLGAAWRVKAAILCTGTYLRGRVIIGEVSFSSGPDGMLPSCGLEQMLQREGIALMRFKTGTPPRVLRSSIDLEQLEEQPGEADALPYSAETDPNTFLPSPQLPCYIVYTNEETHRIIRNNLHRSPLYSGMIEGTGPRYCPSIEDKVVRFADKSRHQLFVEPMGKETEEMYLQGFSSSLPEEVQLEMLHSLSGFSHAQMMRPAYAIEYDCIDPTQLTHTLAFRHIAGLYGAGQFNGTSGYEEAAAQGLIAGINAALFIRGEEALILSRDSSYIGTLIDDLVIKGTREPYRMMTSRSEYRLLLRQDNVGERLLAYGARVGLLSSARHAAYTARMQAVEEEERRARETTIRPSAALDAILADAASAPVTTGIRLSELLRRPELNYTLLAPVDPTRPHLPDIVLQSAEISIKYEGYIKRQRAEAEKMHKNEGKLLPSDIDYAAISGLRLEARQKLAAIRPQNLGQALRISGVSPADISVLMIWLAAHGGEAKHLSTAAEAVSLAEAALPCGDPAPYPPEKEPLP